ncbi:MAG: glycosyltransferase family 2 protein, partial [Pseudomonadota bacterium]
MLKISVVMSVHNGLPYLHECLASLERQTIDDFEIVIVDDASTDGSSDVLRQFCEKDPRARLIENKEKKGLTKSLNIALGIASGNYIARIDADDVCNSKRLEKQSRVLDENPQIFACASGYRMIDGKGKKLRTAQRGLEDWQVRWLLCFNPPAPHPTYFFRRVGPDGQEIRYNEDFVTAQDYELWSRLSTFGETCVIPEVLIDYRRHNSAITTTKREEQAINCAKIGHVNLKGRYPDDVLNDMSAFVDFFAYKLKANPQNIAAAVRGADAMLQFEKKTANRNSAWLKRMTAGILAEGVLSRGRGIA